MRRWIGRLLVLMVICFAVVPTAVAGPSLTPINPILIDPSLFILNPTPVSVAFSPIANRYTGVDPATVFDLNGDLVGDIKVSSTQVTGQNGAQVQLVQPEALNLDNVQAVPSTGYGATATLKLSRVYAVKLTDGSYAKMMVLQATPKVTLWFNYGRPTTSVLKADGQGSHAVLTWDALPDAALGYNIYRYEVDDSAYTVTQLNDFTVQGTTFTDNTATNRYYVYTVQAIKAGGAPGSMTTTAAVYVQYLQRSLVVSLTTGTAKLDGANVAIAAAPVVKNGFMMLPASLLTNAGVQVVFNAASGQVTMTRRIDTVTYTVVMKVDTPEYTWNGTTYKTDVPAYKAGAQVMVPLRVVALVLGLDVTFNSTDRTATIQWAE